MRTVCAVNDVCLDIENIKTALLEKIAGIKVLRNRDLRDRGFYEISQYRLDRYDVGRVEIWQQKKKRKS